MSVNARPTDEAYQQLQKAYDFYNDRLFGNQLPQCLITFHRHPKSYGYFSPARFSSKDGQKTDEIAMNIAYFAVCPIEDTLSTLAHEMVHLWQYHFGLPGKKGYHNTEWAVKMEEIGLIPSSTGLPEGKRVGEKVSHYIQPEGLFEHATLELLSSFFDLSWYDRHVAEKPSAIRNLITMLRKSGVEPHLSELPADAYRQQLDLCIPGDAVPKDLYPKPPKKPKVKKEVTETPGDGNHTLSGGGEGGGDGDEEYPFDVGIELADEYEPQIVPVNKSNRMTYTCPGCSLRLWGKPSVKVMCMDCGKQMEEGG